MSASSENTKSGNLAPRPVHQTHHDLAHDCDVGIALYRLLQNLSGCFWHGKSSYTHFIDDTALPKVL